MQGSLAFDLLVGLGLGYVSARSGLPGALSPCLLLVSSASANIWRKGPAS